jgi:NTP pyrophosphatase (non-canonical NTP hydrolase)
MTTEAITIYDQGEIRSLIECTFGYEAMIPMERYMRLLEEVFEVGRELRIPMDLLDRLKNHVFREKPDFDPNEQSSRIHLTEETGDVSFCLLALAESLDVPLPVIVGEAIEKAHRFTSQDFNARRQKKVDLGLSINENKKFEVKKEIGGGE